MQVGSRGEEYGINFHNDIEQVITYSRGKNNLLNTKEIYLTMIMWVLIYLRCLGMFSAFTMFSDLNTLSHPEQSAEFVRLGVGSPRSLFVSLDGPVR